MAMSAKSRLECSLLVVVVGVSICDAILGGTKQTRHAAWMLCKVMSRIGNFCGAVRDTSTTWCMRGAFMIILYIIDFLLPPRDMKYVLTMHGHVTSYRLYAISHFQCSTVHFKVKMGQHCGETYWFNMIYSNLMFVIFFGVWYASFLQCRCTKSFRILWKQRSKDYSYSPPQRTWPTIWYIKFGGGEHYWLRIEDIFEDRPIVQENQGPQDTSIRLLHTFTLSRFGLSKWLDSRNCLTICCWSAFHTPWSCQPHTCIHIIWLAKHLDATDFAWVTGSGFMIKANPVALVNWNLVWGTLRIFTCECSRHTRSTCETDKDRSWPRVTWFYFLVSRTLRCIRDKEFNPMLPAWSIVFIEHLHVLYR